MTVFLLLGGLGQLRRRSAHIARVDVGRIHPSRFWLIDLRDWAVCVALRLRNGWRVLHLMRTEDSLLLETHRPVDQVLLREKVAS